LGGHQYRPRPAGEWDHQSPRFEKLLANSC
jgi:hypothetical protein